MNPFTPHRAFLGVALLITVGYNLSEDFNDDNTTDNSVPISQTNLSVTHLNLSSASPDLQPLLNLKWPLDGEFLNFIHLKQTFERDTERERTTFERRKRSIQREVSFNVIFALLNIHRRQT